MKKLKVNLLVMFVISLTVVAAHAGNIRDGFQGITWGASITSLEGFTKLYSKNDVDFYANPEKIFQVKEVEPWSRIPERRYALMPTGR